MHERLERVADELTSAVHARPPISAMLIAEACGLTIATPNCRGKRGRGAVLIYDQDLPPDEQESQIALDLAYWRLNRVGLPFDDSDAVYTARAIMLPRDFFLPDMRRTRDAVELRRVHKYATLDMIRARMADLASRALRLVGS